MNLQFDRARLNTPQPTRVIQVAPENAELEYQEPKYLTDGSNGESGEALITFEIDSEPLDAETFNLISTF